MKRRDLTRVGLFEVLAAFPELRIVRCGSLWVEAWVSDEEAAAVNARFPGAITTNA